ncbi:MAG: hypothetical protein HY054_07725 [Proteobacteria bacterium]|nr:hypothetical protein [Pseudomonadota bacterium]
MNRTALGLIIMCAAGLAGPPLAFADPRLDEKVYAPYVQNHVFELELRRGREIGGPLGRAQSDVIEAEYGLNDNVSLALVANIHQEPDGSPHLNGVGLEGVAYLGQIPHTGVDVGLYLEYIGGLNGEDDAAEAKLLLAKNIDRFQALFNFIVERPIGAPASEDFASYGYAASATWRTFGALRVGVEAFGDLGDDRGIGREGAYVGPQLRWEGHPGSSPIEIEVEAGWLAAVGADRDEADSQVRFTIAVERRL